MIYQVFYIILKVTDYIVIVEKENALHIFLIEPIQSKPIRITRGLNISSSYVDFLSKKQREVISNPDNEELGHEKNEPEVLFPCFKLC